MRNSVIEFLGYERDWIGFDHATSSPARSSLALEVGRPTSKAREKRPGDEVVDHRKKNHLLSTLCTFQKEKKHPNFFSRLKLYFPDAFQVCKIALDCKLQDTFKNLRLWLKELCHEIYQNSNAGYRHQIEENINEK